MNCERPDRDVPRLVCGYPLPCPYHTVVIDTTTEPTTITEPVTVRIDVLSRERLRQLAAIAKHIPSKARRPARRRKAKR